MHYVSSSPRQLYPALTEFIDDNEFPSGTVHLRNVRLSAELTNKQTSKQHKPSTIQCLLDIFPERHFILVDDSGEADREIYGEIARHYSSQILAVYIRDLGGHTQRPNDKSQNTSRYSQAFRSLDDKLWHIFSEPDDMPELSIP